MGRPLAAWAPVLVLLVLAALYAVAHTRAASGNDFAVFWRAGARFWRGEPLYRLSDAGFAFKYAPAAAAFFAPLSFLPPRFAFTTFDLLSALALLRVMQWSAARAGANPGWAAHVAALALVSPFAVRLFALGQSDALLLWWMVVSEDRADRQPWRSGALWAAAALFKPPYLAFLVLAVGWRQWRRVGGLAAGLLAGAGVGIARYGWAGHLDLLRGWRALVSTTTPGLLCNEQNQSAYAIACEYLVPPSTGWKFTAAVSALAVAACAAAAVAALQARARDPARGRFSAAAGVFYVTAFLSPLGWWTNLVSTVPLIYLLLALARRAAPEPARRLALASLAALVFGWHLLQRVAGVDLLTLLERRAFGLAAFVAALAAFGAAGIAARATPARRLAA